MNTFNKSKLAALLVSSTLLQACGGSGDKASVSENVSLDEASETVSKIYDKANYINDSVSADNLTGLWMSVVEFDESEDDESVTFDGTLYQRTTLSIVQNDEGDDSFELYHCYGDNQYDTQTINIEDGEFSVTYSVTDKVNEFDEDLDELEEEVAYVIKGEVTENVLIKATMYVQVNDGEEEEEEEEVEVGVGSWVKYADTPSIPGSDYTNIGSITGSIKNDAEDDNESGDLDGYSAYCMRQSSIVADASFTDSESGDDLITFDGTYSDSTLYVVAFDGNDIESSKQILIDATTSSFKSDSQVNDGGPSLPDDIDVAGDGEVNISTDTGVVILQDINKETSISESWGEVNSVSVTFSNENLENIEEKSCDADAQECTDFSIDQSDDSSDALESLTGSLVSIEKDDDENLPVANDALGRADIEFTLEFTQE